MDQQRDDNVLLAGSAPVFDAQAALGRFRERAAREAIAPRISWADALMARVSLAGTAWTRAAVAAVAVVLVASIATATGVADTVLTVFEPKQVATIQVDPSQLRGVPDPATYGTLTWIAEPSLRPVADASAAAAAAGFAPLVPAALPARVPAQVSYSVAGEAKATFRFDEAKARAAAARVNATMPPMPAAVAATTLTMTGGPAILQRYGQLPDAARGGPATVLGQALVIVQSRAPVVTSNGATVDELRSYALAQPGIPPSVAAQIRAIGDPVRTLLLPIGIDMKDARTVTVRGTQGYLVGDETGLGSAVVWLERGQVIGVLASLGESDLLALVNGLR